MSFARWWQSETKWDKVRHKVTTGDRDWHHVPSSWLVFPLGLCGISHPTITMQPVSHHGPVVYDGEEDAGMSSGWHTWSVVRMAQLHAVEMDDKVCHPKDALGSEWDWLNCMQLREGTWEVTPKTHLVRSEDDPVEWEDKAGRTSKGEQMTRPSQSAAPSQIGLQSTVRSPPD